MEKKSSNQTELYKQFYTTFEQTGKEFAKDTNINPNSINIGLDTIYNIFLKKHKLDENSIDNAIKTLEEDIVKTKQDSSNKEANNKQLLIDNENLQRQIDDKKEEILKADNEILEITGGKREADETKLNLYGIFTILSLLGVLFSYMATMGSALLGLEEDDTLIRNNVFGDLIDSGTGNLIISVFVALIPIGCGYFYTKLKKENKPVSVYLFPLLIVLIIDIVIGYLLAKNIYIAEYQQGLHEENWEPTYILKDLSFWIVLVINFALYMTFSYFANAYFEEKERLSPNSLVEKIKNKIKLLEEKMEEFKNLMSENKKKIEANISDIEKNITSIQKMEEDITNYKNGIIPLDAPLLKNLISQYLKGYQAYVNLMVEDTEKAKSIVDEVLKKAENWFNELEKNNWKQTINTNKNFFNINND